MLFTKLVSVTGVKLEDDKADYKRAKRVGQYKFSDKAVYMASGEYVPYESVSEIVCDKSSVHVAGCCAGGVWVERMIFTTPLKKYQFIFDSKKEIDKALELVKVLESVPINKY